MINKDFYTFDGLPLGLEYIDAGCLDSMSNGTSKDLIDVKMRGLVNYIARGLETIVVEGHINQTYVKYFKNSEKKRFECVIEVWLEKGSAILELSRQPSSLKVLGYEDVDLDLVTVPSLSYEFGSLKKYVDLNMLKKLRYLENYMNINYDKLSNGWLADYYQPKYLCVFDTVMYNDINVAQTLCLRGMGLYEDDLDGNTKAILSYSLIESFFIKDGHIKLPPNTKKLGL